MISEQFGVLSTCDTIYVGCYREFTGKMPITVTSRWRAGMGARTASAGIAMVVSGRASLRRFWHPWASIPCRLYPRTVLVRDRLRVRPAPTYLLSAEAAARYGAYLQQAPAIARKDYEADLRTVQAEVLLLTSQLHWEYKRAVHYALRNIVTVRASALFRYCFAMAEQLWDVAQHFHDQALLQYVFQQEVLDVAWGAHIPSLLREEGLRLRSQILGGQ
jgi:hypothetical protein